jgi:hypothetical protein
MRMVFGLYYRFMPFCMVYIVLLFANIRYGEYEAKKLY